MDGGEDLTRYGLVRFSAAGRVGLQLRDVERHAVAIAPYTFEGEVLIKVLANLMEGRCCRDHADVRCSDACDIAKAI